MINLGQPSLGSGGSEVTPKTLPLGVKLLSAFFAFGTAMCLLTIALLAFPGSLLAPLWRFNPAARTAFQSIGNLAFLLMAVVGCACAGAGIGLARRARWGRSLAILVLGTNLLGDLGAAIGRGDYRTLIGLPIGGALILYLNSRTVRNVFGVGVPTASESSGNS